MFIIKIENFELISFFYNKPAILILVCFHTVVGDYINIMKTTFDFNYDLCQAFNQHGYTKTWKQREALIKKKAFP